MGQTVGAIIDWFVSAPRRVQFIVLDGVPADGRLGYAKVLRAIAEELESGVIFDPAAADGSTARGCIKQK